VYGTSVALFLSIGQTSAKKETSVAMSRACPLRRLSHQYGLCHRPDSKVYIICLRSGIYSTLSGSDHGENTEHDAAMSRLGSLTCDPAILWVSIHIYSINMLSGGVGKDRLTTGTWQWVTWWLHMQNNRSDSGPNPRRKEGYLAGPAQLDSNCNECGTILWRY